MAPIVHRQWSESAMKRIGDATLKTEKQHPVADDTTPDENKGDDNAAVFVLYSPVADGVAGTGKRMKPYFGTGDGDTPMGFSYWLPNAPTELVHLAFGAPQNFYPTGAMVFCNRGPGGNWFIVSGTDSIVMPNVADCEKRNIKGFQSGMILEASQSSKLYGYARVNTSQGSFNNIRLRGSDGYLSTYPIWLSSFVILTGGIYPQRTLLEFDTAQTGDGPPQDDTEENPDEATPRVCPCIPYDETTNARARVLYNTFDGKDQNGDDLPTELVERLGLQSDSNGKVVPSTGRRWVPGKDGKLRLGIVAMELYWWEIKSDPYEARDFNINVFHPLHPHYEDLPQAVRDNYHSAYGDPGAYGPVRHGWWVGGSWGGGSWGLGWDWWGDGPSGGYWTGGDFRYWGDLYIGVTKELWAEPCNGPPTGISSDDDPPASRSRFFIAPHRFWQRAQFQGYNWIYDNYRYNPNGYWGPYGNYGYWGPYGNYGYWGGYWGGWPPVDVDEVETPPPEPGPCRTLIRRGLYGWLVWDYGFDIADNSTDVETETTIIVGALSSGDSLVVYDSNQPEPSEDE